MNRIAGPMAETALAASTDRADDRADAGAWFLIFVLTLAYTASFIDRQVLNLLVAPLKAEFGLNDTRLSLLQGLAFTSAYILMSPIFGRLVDTGSRRGVLICGVSGWSIATGLCGLSASYWQLFMARFGVGGAEATLTPAAWSMIGDRFSERTMARAFSIYMMGPYLGGGLALIFGGIVLGSAANWDLSAIPLLNAMKPWQLVFLMASLPGFLVVLLLLLFIKEPVRQSRLAEETEKMALGDVWRIFVELRSFYGNFYAGMSSSIISLYAFPAWMPSVFGRQFGISASQVGVQYGAAVLITGSIGVLSGPWVSRWLDRNGTGGGGLMLVPFFASLALIPISASLAFANSYGAAMAIAAVAGFVYSLPKHWLPARFKWLRRTECGALLRLLLC